LAQFAKFAILSAHLVILALFCTMKFRGALVDSLLIICGILSAGMGLKGFLLPSHFIDGGVTGISILLADATHLPLSVLIFVINLPFLYLGYRKLGATFALKSAAAIAGLSLVLAFMHFPDVTPDKLLTAVFGGVFIGAGIGMAIRGGAVLDGTEIAALLVSKKTQVVRVSDVILILNVVIFGAAVFQLGVEKALYSILTYLSASKMIDFILERPGAIYRHDRSIRQRRRDPRGHNPNTWPWCYRLPGQKRLWQGWAHQLPAK
jgi:uncharacterized membrane-anchored protein YitT (DUF2179 family)